MGQFGRAEGGLFLAAPGRFLARSTDVVDMNLDVAHESVDDPVVAVDIEGKHGWREDDGNLRSSVYVGVIAEDAVNDPADLLAVGRIKLS